MSEAWTVFSEWVMNQPADRIVGLITTAAVALMAAYKVAGWGCKGAWWGGALARRALTPAPVVLADEVQLLVDALRDSGERHTEDLIATGPTVVGPNGHVYIGKVKGKNCVAGKDITDHYTPDELRAIRLAADDRRKHFAAIDREQARMEAIGMPPATGPVLSLDLDGPDGAGDVALPVEPPRHTPVPSMFGHNRALPRGA